MPSRVEWPTAADRAGRRLPGLPDGSPLGGPLDEMSSPADKHDPTSRHPTGRRSAAWARVLALALATLPAGAQESIRLPDIGDPASALISPAQEREIGKAFMRQARYHLKIIEDPEISQYIQTLGYDLVSRSGHDSYGFEFFVVADSAINAFAAPGGYIGVHSGLITATESESELASVVAHEIAHVVQHHLVRQYALADRNKYAAIAGMVAAILLGMANSDAGQAAASAVAAGSIQSQLNFTRANEEEADRVGMQMLASAGYDPRSMPSFFEKLQNASRYYRKPPEFLSTHPVTTNRIADSRGRAEQFPYRQVPDSEAYRLVREKLRVITSADPARLLADYDAQLKGTREATNAALRYGRALTLARVNKPDEARRELEELMKEDPERLNFRVSLAKLELENHDSDRALALYRDAYGLYPDSKMLVYGYVEALVRTGQGRAALRIIDDYGRLHSMDSTLYRLSAEAYKQTGNDVESRLALAEHYYINGELESAIHQLQIASGDSSSDFYRASRVEARLRELREEQQEVLRR